MIGYPASRLAAKLGISGDAKAAFSAMQACMERVGGDEGGDGLAGARTGLSARDGRALGWTEEPGVLPLMRDERATS